MSDPTQGQESSPIIQQESDPVPYLESAPVIEQQSSGDATVMPKEPKNNGSVNNGSMSVSWEGPLPPPAALKGYNDVVPDGAERLFRMAEKEQEARINKDKSLIQLEHKSLDHNARALMTGKYLGAGLSVFFSVCAVASYYWFANLYLSCAFIAFPLLSVVLAIVNQQKETKDEE